MARMPASIKANIPVLFMKEGNTFIVYSPTLDLSTCAPTFDEAKKNFHQAMGLFFSECVHHGTLNQALESLGWQQLESKAWQPPIVVGQESLSVTVPSAS